MFIVLEGIDGCGKTTQSVKLAERLAERLGSGRVVRTYEPGDWRGGARIREFLLNTDFASAWSEFFLFMTDRCEHVARVIEPALADGCVVISDRYNPSTVAYQIYGNANLPEDTARKLTELPYLIGLPEPDVVVLLDIDVAEARRRLESRGKGNLFDARGDEFFERVRGGYAAMMAEPGKTEWIVVDTSADKDEIAAEIARRLEPILERVGL